MSAGFRIRPAYILVQPRKLIETGREVYLLRLPAAYSHIQAKDDPVIVLTSGTL